MERNDDEEHKKKTVVKPIEEITLSSDEESIAVQHHHKLLKKKLSSDDEPVFIKKTWPQQTNSDEEVCTKKPKKKLKIKLSSDEEEEVIKKTWPQQTNSDEEEEATNQATIINLINMDNNHFIQKNKAAILQLTKDNKVQKEKEYWQNCGFASGKDGQTVTDKFTHGEGNRPLQTFGFALDKSRVLRERTNFYNANENAPRTSTAPTSYELDQVENINFANIFVPPRTRESYAINRKSDILDLPPGTDIRSILDAPAGHERKVANSLKSNGDWDPKIIANIAIDFYFNNYRHRNNEYAPGSIQYLAIATFLKGKTDNQKSAPTLLGIDPLEESNYTKKNISPKPPTHLDEFDVRLKDGTLVNLVHKRETKKEASVMAFWLESTLGLLIEDLQNYSITATPSFCSYKPIPLNTLALVKRAFSYRFQLNSLRLSIIWPIVLKNYGSRISVIRKEVFKKNQQRSKQEPKQELDTDSE